MLAKLRFPSVALWLLAATLGAEAHDPGLSTAFLSLESDRLDALLTLASADLEALVPMDSDQDGKVSPEEFAAGSKRLESAARGALEVWFDGHRVPTSHVTVDADDKENVHLRLRFPGRATSSLRVHFVLVERLPRGHRQYLALEDERGNMLEERLLDATGSILQKALVGAVDGEAEPRSFGKFVILGVEHILTGYDHLLFLLALFVAGGSFASVAWIITSFTLAHSITLALAALSVVQLSGSIVEPLIAASIVYVGAENLFRRRLRGRWLLTFGFGLVHGLGFASVLRELGVGASDGAVGLILAFNLGVELGQISLALLVLPLVWRLRRLPEVFPGFFAASSLLVILAGSYWLVERTL